MLYRPHHPSQPVSVFPPQALIYDALALSDFCNDTQRPDERSLPRHFPPHFSIPQAAGSAAVYADAVHGNDRNDGSEGRPVQTIAQAVQLSRGRRRPATIVLRGGTFFQRDAVLFDSRDSGLTIQNYPGETAWVSGGVRLTDLQWKPYSTSGKSNIYVADVASFNLPRVHGLRVNERRASPARFPNADPETQFWPIGYVPSKQDDWLEPKIAPTPNPAQLVNVTSPNRDWDGLFPYYGGGKMSCDGRERK